MDTLQGVTHVLGYPPEADGAPMTNWYFQYQHMSLIYTGASRLTILRRPRRGVNEQAAAEGPASTFCSRTRGFAAWVRVWRAGGLPVEDRIAIQDLIARYAWALDTGDVDSLVACFTPDARVIEEVFEDPDRWEGHEGIRAPGRALCAPLPAFPAASTM